MADLPKVEYGEKKEKKRERERKEKGAFIQTGFIFHHYNFNCRFFMQLLCTNRKTSSKVNRGN